METPYKNLTPRRKEMLEMRLQGKTLEEIGEKIGISRERVRQILERIPRSQSQSSKS